MLRGSVLYTIYGIWCESRTFAVMQKLHNSIAALIKDSAILNWLFFGEKAEQYYRNSVFAGILDLIFSIPYNIFFAICKAARTSIAARICEAICGYISFEIIAGIFICSMFVIPHDYWNNAYAAIGAVLLLVLYIFTVASGRRSEWGFSKMGLWFWLFVLACVLCVPFSTDIKDSIRMLILFFAAFIFCYVIAADFSDEKRLKTLLGFMYIALMLMSLLAIAQRFFNLVQVNASFIDVKLNEGVPGRVYGSLNNPNNLSEFILMFMPLSAAFAVSAEKLRQRILLSAGLAFPAIALVMTYSRGAWIGVALAVLVFTYCVNKRLLPAILILGTAAVPLMPASVLTRLSTIGSSKDTSTLHRFDIWKGVFNMLGDYGLTGIGLGPNTFKALYPNYAVGLAKVGAYHSQMQYLEIILETGIAGLISFMMLLFRTAGSGIKRIADEKKGLRFYVIAAALSSMAGLAFTFIVEYVWFYQRLLFAFFIYLGILIAAARKE